MPISLMRTNVLRLSFLNKRPIDGLEKVLQCSVAIAQRAKELGDRRFWVTEHHSSSALAGSSPDVLPRDLPVRTNHIRIPRKA